MVINKIFTNVFILILLSIMSSCTVSQTTELSKDTFKTIIYEYPSDWKMVDVSDTYKYLYINDTDFVMIGVYDMGDSSMEDFYESDTFFNGFLETGTKSLPGYYEISRYEKIFFNGLITKEVIFNFYNKDNPCQGIISAASMENQLLVFSVFCDNENVFEYQDLLWKLISSVIYDKTKKVELTEVTSEPVVSPPENTISPSIQPNPSATPDVAKKYDSGQYKCSVDIKPGVYIAFTVSDKYGFLSISTDANGSDVIHADIFENNSIFEIKEGEYVDLSRCYAINFDNAPAISPQNGVYNEGHYKVGKHIKSGEYKLRCLNGEKNAFYSISSDPNGNDVIHANHFEGERYINLQDGQYLSLLRCQLILPGY